MPNTVTSVTGRLSYQNNPDDPGPSIDLLSEFLKRIQWAPPSTPQTVSPPLPESEWVILDNGRGTRERTTWLTNSLLDEILGEELSFSLVSPGAFQSKGHDEQVRFRERTHE